MEKQRRGAPTMKVTAKVDPVGASDTELFTDEHHQSSEESKVQKLWSLLSEVTRLQHKNMLHPGSVEAHVCILRGLMDIFHYQSGFIGELDRDDHGIPCLRVCASSSSSIGGPERRVHTHDMSSLFGKVFATKQCVIVNKGQSKTIQWQIPIDNYIGLPLCSASGEVQGMICFINKQNGGFGKSDITSIQPFLFAASNLIEASSHVQKHRRLEYSFEAKVRERVRDLEHENERLRQQNVNTARASSAQLQHFACMSHEIRTPLNCIIGMSSLLQDNDTPQRMKESLNMIVTSGNLLLTIVNDVLDWSKLLTGNVSICIEPSYLQETLDNVVTSMETRAQGLKIRPSYDIRLPSIIETDSRRLLQVLYNLLGNAVKFGKAGTEIEFSLKVLSVEEASDTSSCHSLDESLPSCDAYDLNQQNVIRFVVKDYGKGIEQSEFENIFKAFHQASPDTEKLYGGTGLGLAIAANLVRAMGGNIWVDSQVGEWTEFTFDLPMRNQPLFTGSEAKDALMEYWICAVDTDPNTLILLERIFGFCQLKIHAFVSLQDLQEEIRLQQPSDHRFLCFVNESCFCQDRYEIIQRMVKKIQLVSFGPKYSVTTSDLHFRSLDGIIPSALLKSVVALVKRADLNETPPDSTQSLSTSKEVRRRIVKIEDLRILIAEDNVVNQKVLGRMLQRLAVQHVVIVENGQQAVEKASSEPFDLILMDMQMPIMDGITACRMICDREEAQKDNRLRVVFVTAHVSDAYQQECKDAGGSGFLPKPVQLKNVRTILEEVAASIMVEECVMDFCEE